MSRPRYAVGTKVTAQHDYHAPYPGAVMTIKHVVLDAPAKGQDWNTADVWIETEEGFAAPWYYFNVVEQEAAIPA